MSTSVQDEPVPVGELAIETQRLTKRFGERAAIDEVDLRVPRGSAFGFLGPTARARPR